MKVVPGRILLQLALLALLASVLPQGCHRPMHVVYPDPIPLADATELVNGNIARIRGALRAVGPVDGHIAIDQGSRRSFHVEGVMFYLQPRSFRLDLKKLGERQLLVGSNDEFYWVYRRDEDRYTCGRHDDAVEPELSMPIRPQQLMDALGLTPIDRVASGRRVGVVQRVVEPHQQVLFLERDDIGRIVLEKEYWLDLASPGIVRRVVFRDALGRVLMESRLDDHARLGPDGPWLPRRIEAKWFDSPAELRLHVRRWTVHEDIDGKGVQFATPPECSPDAAWDSDLRQHGLVPADAAQ